MSKSCPTKSETVAAELGINWKSLKLKNATRKLPFTVHDCNIKAATPGKPSACVVAVAIQETVGDLLQHVLVGPAVTLVITDTTIIRFRTPDPLRKAIPAFDRTKVWNLAPGTYNLHPYKMEDRHQFRTGKSLRKKPVLTPKRALKTRFIPRALLDMIPA